MLFCFCDVPFGISSGQGLLLSMVDVLELDIVSSIVGQLHPVNLRDTVLSMNVNFLGVCWDFNLVMVKLRRYTRIGGNSERKKCSEQGLGNHSGQSITLDL